MRPEHVAANELVDIAITGDRGAYKAKLAEIEGKFSRVAADTIKQQAAMQYRMETNDRRFTGWRADWINERRRPETDGGAEQEDSRAAASPGSGSA